MSSGRRRSATADVGGRLMPATTAHRDRTLKARTSLRIGSSWALPCIASRRSPVSHRLRYPNPTSQIASDAGWYMISTSRSGQTSVDSQASSARGDLMVAEILRATRRRRTGDLLILELLSKQDLVGREPTINAALSALEGRAARF